MMCEMLVTSMPRPTTSVATSQRILPSRKPFITRSRADCGRSPWIVSTRGSGARQPRDRSCRCRRLRAAEDDRLRGFLPLQEPHQQVELPLRIDGEVELLDRLHRQVLRRKVQHLRLAHVALGQALHRRGDRGAEQAASAATAGSGGGSSRYRAGNRCPACGRPRPARPPAARSRSAHRGSSGPARGPACPRSSTPRRRPARSACGWACRRRRPRRHDCGPRPTSRIRRGLARPARAWAPARGPAAATPRCWGWSCSRIGMAKAAVLPVPVCAWPITSAPARARGMNPSCTGVGVS